AEAERNAEALRDLLNRVLDPGEALLRVFDDEAAPDRQRGGREDAALLDQRELGGAAADIDVEQRRLVAAREGDRARAVRGKLALHVMAGRGADEAAGLLGEQVGDGTGVLALDGLAGEDHGAAVVVR